MELEPKVEEKKDRSRSTSITIDHEPGSINEEEKLPPKEDAIEEVRDESEVIIQNAEITPPEVIEPPIAPVIEVSSVEVNIWRMFFRCTRLPAGRQKELTM